MSDKKVMILGRDGAGKSCVADLLEGAQSHHTPRQDCLYRTKCFEVPGSYVENHWMNNIMLMLAYNQAKAAVFLLDGTTGESLFSPGYARAFTIPVLGVLTKVEQLSEAERERGLAQLTQAGCEQTQVLSLVSGEGIAELNSWLQANANVSLEHDFWEEGAYVLRNRRRAS